MQKRYNIQIFFPSRRYESHPRHSRSPFVSLFLSFALFFIHPHSPTHTATLMSEYGAYRTPLHFMYNVGYGNDVHKSDINPLLSVELAM